MTGNHKFILIFTALIATVGFTVAEQEQVKVQRKGWYTDIEVAKKVAQTEGKDLLIEFTRSKGCGWCLKLEKEVLFELNFQEKMSKNYVMVILNYPHDDSQWSNETRGAFEELKNYYRIRKFPYLVFTDADGRPYERKSYRDRKPKEYFEEIAGISKQRQERDILFTAAEKGEGKQKARILEKGLSKVSRKYHRYYPDIINQIAKADPEDISGFVAKVRVDEVRSRLDRRLKGYYDEGDYAVIANEVDNYISEYKPSGEALQAAMIYKLQSLYMTKRYSEATVVADKVIGINDASRSSRYASSFKKRIERIDAEKQEKDE